MILLVSPARRVAQNRPSDSKLLRGRHQTVRSKQAVGEKAVGETPRSKREVVARRLFEGEAGLAIDRGAARNPYLGGVTTARESSPA